MAVEKTICFVCGEGGGRLRYSPKGWFHVGRCYFRQGDKVAPTPTFPFTTDHLCHPSDVKEGGPLVINNIRELRRYERESGTACDPYSNNVDYQGSRY
jgi:hypothetical protein